MGGVGWVDRVGGVRKGEIIAPKRIVKVTSTSARPLPHFLPPSFPPPSHTPLVTPNRGFTATCKDHQPARHQPVLPPVWPTPLLRRCSLKPRPERHRLLISGTEQRDLSHFSLGSISDMDLLLKCPPFCCLYRTSRWASWWSFWRCARRGSRRKKLMTQQPEFCSLVTRVRCRCV